MRVGIVNDLAVACEALRRVVASDPALVVAWIARDGIEAIERTARDRPDVSLMDLIMPRLNGVEATRQIMRATPCPILVVTATVSGNASLVYEALGAGALDAVNTPTLGSGGAVTGGADLVRRLHLVARSTAARSSPRLNAPPIPASQPNALQARAPVPAMVAPSETARSGPIIVAIGASTGGPRAVASVLSALPRDLPAVILVVQHVSVDFVAGYVEWLSAETGRNLTIARHGALLREGDTLVAGEDLHLRCTRAGTIEYRAEPVDHVHRPAVDELFSSLTTFPRPGIAVLLTGMGRDGAEGMLKLRDAGWHTIAQDESTSVVWGMPGVAHKLGAATATLPIDEIGPAIAARVRQLAR